MKKFNSVRGSKQAGMTLIEVMSSLAIFAIVVGGALALFGSASSSQASTQMTSDLNALRTNVKSLWYGQGSYGTASLNATLITSKKVPTTMTVASPNITNSFNGAVVVTGATTQFTISVAAIPVDVCTSLLATASGWNSVQVTGGTAQTAFPIAPDVAAAQCSLGSTITFAAS